jgi:hypothetical protein
MPITRTREVEVADAYGDDDGGVTVLVEGGRQALTPEEADELGQTLMQAALEARQTARLQAAITSTNQPAF